MSESRGEYGGDDVETTAERDEREQLSDRAQEARSWFEHRKRDTARRRDDAEVWFVKDGAPDWVREIVYAAHHDGGKFPMLPDDTRYEIIAEALAAIAEPESGDDESLSETRATFADDVPIYTGERLAWLASRADRYSYIEQAVEDVGWAEVGERGFLGIVALGIYAERDEVFGLVLDALAEERVTDASRA